MKKILCCLIFITFFSSSFTVFKIMGFSVYLLRLAFILFTVFHVIGFVSSKNRPVRRPGKHACVIGLTVFCVFALLTGFWCKSPHAWINGWINLIIDFCLIYYVYYYTETEKDLRSYLGAYACGILMTVIVSIYEFQTGRHLNSSYLDAFEIGTQAYRYLAKAPTAFLYNPNNVAISVVLGITLGSYIFKPNNRSVFVKAFTALFMLACIYVDFATGSRGGILICLVAIVLNYLLTKKNFSKKAVTLGVLFFAAAVIVNLTAPLILTQLRYSGLLDVSNRFVVIGSQDSGRFNLLKEGYQVAKENHFLGGGPSSAEILIGAKFGTMASVHMFWLETLVNFGIVGLGCVIWFYFKCLIAMLKYRKYSVMAKDIAVMLLLFLPCSVIPPTIYTLYNVLLIFGFSLACEKLCSRNDLEKGKGVGCENRSVESCAAH